MAFHVTALYASILAIASIVLSIIVSTRRGKVGVSILDGGNAELAVWMRRQQNFVEYVPFTLFMMALAEAAGMRPMWLHVIGIVLLVSRLIHPFGVNATQPGNPLRILGTVGTHLCLLACVVFLLSSLY